MSTDKTAVRRAGVTVEERSHGAPGAPGRGPRAVAGGVRAGGGAGAATGSPRGRFVASRLFGMDLKRTARGRCDPADFFPCGGRAAEEGNGRGFSGRTAGRRVVWPAIWGNGRAESGGGCGGDFG